LRIDQRLGPSWRRVWSAWRPAAARIIGREVAKLGHTVKLTPPKYVKAYVKRGKTDAGDAAAICEAVEERQHLLASGSGRRNAAEHVVRAGEGARATGLSTPWIWNTFFARSSPMVIIVVMSDPLW
jgi:hypothetical protein